MNFFGIGGLEIIVIAGLAFFLLGPKKMIETSRSAGKLLRELRTERDKFTRMVMQEFDDDEEKEPSAARSRSADGVSAASSAATEVGPGDSPEGAVSRPRGRMPGMADGGDAGSDATSDEPEQPVPPPGG